MPVFDQRILSIGLLPVLLVTTAGGTSPLPDRSGLTLLTGDRVVVTGQAHRVILIKGR